MKLYLVLLSIILLILNSTYVQCQSSASEDQELEQEQDQENEENEDPYGDQGSTGVSAEEALCDVASTQKYIVDIPDFNMTKFYIRSPENLNLLQIMKKYPGMERVQNRTEADLAIQFYVRNHNLKYKKGALKAFLKGDTQIDKKDRLTKHLKRYDGLQISYPTYSSDMFYPETYQIEIVRNRKNPKFYKQTTPDERTVVSKKLDGVWILKNVGTVQGNGIKMIYNITDFQKTLRYKQKGKLHKNFDYPKTKDGTYILQKYFEKPLLINKTKFDMKVYVSVVCSDPFIATFQMGYFVTTDRTYDLMSKDEFVHVVNPAFFANQNKKKGVEHDKYSVLKLENEMKEILKKEYPEFTDEIYEEIKRKVKSAATYAFQSTLPYLRQPKGDIQIFSLDFVIDEDYNPNLIEVNSYPNINYFPCDVGTYVQQPLIENWLKNGLHLRHMSKEEIIEKSKLDPGFFCKYVDYKNCDILINTASNYYYLDDVNIVKKEGRKYSVNLKEQLS